MRSPGAKGAWLLAVDSIQERTVIYRNLLCFSKCPSAFGT